MGKNFETAQTRFLGEECMPFSSRFRQNKTDTGILGCTDPNSICVKDTLSSLGGRCVSQDAGRRELQDAEDYCTEKCTGNSACEGLSQDFIDNNIGENSCCGESACRGLNGKFHSWEILTLYILFLLLFLIHIWNQ